MKICALGQASASLMGAHALGRNSDARADVRDALAAFLSGRRKDPGTWPDLELFRGVRPYRARHPSILLAFEAAAEASG